MTGSNDFKSAATRNPASRSWTTIAAAAAALAIAGAAAGQDGEDADVGLASGEACGASFASSGAASNAAYVGAQLAACDARVRDAQTAVELNAAAESILMAHQETLGRWQAVARDLMDAATTPAAPTTDDAEEGEADAAPDLWTLKLAERHAVETGMDGLRILLRLAYQLADTYADPAQLVAGLAEEDAGRAQDVLASRMVCASGGRAPRPNRPGTAPSWFAFADVLPTDEHPEAVNYDVEVFDELAKVAEDFVLTDLETAPELGVSTLTSYATKRDCARREFPSEQAAG